MEYTRQSRQCNRKILRLHLCTRNTEHRLRREGKLRKFCRCTTSQVVKRRILVRLGVCSLDRFYHLLIFYDQREYIKCGLVDRSRFLKAEYFSLSHITIIFPRDKNTSFCAI